MTCPSCGSPGAYVGLAKVECDREGCEKYVAPPVPEIAPLKPSPALVKFCADFDARVAEMEALFDMSECLAPIAPRYSVARWTKPFYIPASAMDDQPNPGATAPAGSSSTTGPS